jgi:hypothetical protein
MEQRSVSLKSIAPLKTLRSEWDQNPVRGAVYGFDCAAAAFAAFFLAICL